MKTTFPSEVTITRKDGRTILTVSMPDTVLLDADPPELELGIEVPVKAKKPRPRNLPMDALVEAVGLDEKAIGTNEGKAVREIRLMCMGDSDEEIAKQIRLRANTWRIQYPDCKLTVNALVKHWSALLPTNQVRYNV